jgi:hypothetical protein
VGLHVGPVQASIHYALIFWLKFFLIAPCLAHNLFDGRAALGLDDNVGVDFVVAQMVLVLNPLRCGEQRRVDERRAERRSYLAQSICARRRGRRRWRSPSDASDPRSGERGEALCWRQVRNRRRGVA